MSTSLSTSGVSSHRAMAAIEARRLARHPVFIVGVVLAFAVLALMLMSDDPSLVDTLSIPVVLSSFSFLDKKQGARLCVQDLLHQDS